MSKDIFDTSDLSDVPVSIKKDVGSVGVDTVGNNLLKIFDIAGKALDINQITVAYYRLFKKEKTRKQICAKLYSMSKATKPLVESVKGKRGAYRKAGK